LPARAACVASIQVRAGRLWVGVLAGALALSPLSVSARTKVEVPAGTARGAPNRGRLVDGVRLADEGPGWQRPKTWRDRGLSFGTPALVDAIRRAAGAVADAMPGAVLYVADLSYARGGASAWHRSHQNGLDVDLIYYGVDDDGNAAPPPAEMTDRRYGANLEAGKWRFDCGRNWLLLRAFLTDVHVRVKNVFVAAQVERALLAEAKRREEPEWLVARAAAVMSQSGAAHDDHMHVRIACPDDDVRAGCRDLGGGDRARPGKRVAKVEKKPPRRPRGKRRGRR
jgi:penicillin-insensitive murein endopeptidase